MDLLYGQTMVGLQVCPHDANRDRRTSALAPSAAGILVPVVKIAKNDLPYLIIRECRLFCLLRSHMDLSFSAT